MIELEAENVTEVCTSFGRIGVKAEEVALEALREAEEYLAAGVPVGRHLADQIMLPLGIGAYFGTGGGAFRTLPFPPTPRRTWKSCGTSWASTPR